MSMDAAIGTLFRASVDLHTEGRTLLGVALPFETPKEVRDILPGGRMSAPYREAFARASFDDTLRGADPFPLFYWHEYLFTPNAMPVGNATYARSDSEMALLYRAELANTRKADEMLDLVKNLSVRSVSVGFEPGAHLRRRDGQGPLVWRTAVRAKELSLAPTGFGQYPQSKVLAVRALDASFADISEAVSDAIEAALFGPDGAPMGACVYMRDIGQDWAVYEVEGSEADGDVANLNYLQRVTYSVAADGSVTLGDAVPVRQEYVPVTSTAATRSTTPALDAWRRRKAKLVRA